jgi:hypothetical protein
MQGTCATAAINAHCCGPTTPNARVGSLRQAQVADQQGNGSQCACAKSWSGSNCERRKWIAPSTSWYTALATHYSQSNNLLCGQLMQEVCTVS